jgi:predicted RNA binding protein YcfA (HicA-like mRNA interferase family)
MAKKYGEVRRILYSHGWRIIRQRGSHEIWTHPEMRGNVIVAGKASDSVPPGTLASIRKRTGLEQLR